MKIAIAFVLCLLLLISIISTRDGKAQSTEFPAAQGVLLRMRDRQDVKAMRAHAWSLFSYVTNEEPEWRDWKTKCDVHLQLAKCPAPSSSPNHAKVLRGLEIPTQIILQFKVPPSRGLNGRSAELPNHSQIGNFVTSFRQNPQFAAVLYNRDAANHILNEKLYDTSKLNELNSELDRVHAPDHERESPPFPPSSIIVKTVWQLLYPGPGSPGEIGPVHTWSVDQANALRAQGEGHEADPSHWNDKISIDITLQTHCQDNDYDVGAKVPLDCFDYAELTEDDLAALPGNVQLVGSEVRPAKKAYLILLGIHIITKEIPDWVWSTFWWDPRASSSLSGRDHPDKIKGKWRHFAMDTTLSGATPWDCQDSKSKICFNPYLEVALPNGVVSNCVGCHRYAVFHDPSRVQQGFELGLPWRPCSPLTDCYTSDPRYFGDSLQLDFMWTVATNQDSQIHAFLEQLNTYLLQLDQKPKPIK